MNWPLVSRKLLEAERAAREHARTEHATELEAVRRAAAERIEQAKDEIAWLREQNGDLIEQIIRIERREHQMPEITPEVRRGPKQMDPMPAELEKYIKSFRNPSLVRDMMRRAYRKHASGEAWLKIEAEVRNPPPEPEEVAVGEP